jgi:hypothetical protein
MMREDRLRLNEVLGAYGADPARWPATDRHLAALLDGADASEARALDRLLARASPVAVPAELSDRIAAGLPAKPPVNVLPFRPRLRRLSTIWPAAAAMAAALAIGLYLGVANPGGYLFPATDTAALDDPLGLIEIDQADDAGAGDSV